MQLSTAENIYIIGVDRSTRVLATVQAVGSFALGGFISYMLFREHFNRLDDFLRHMSSTLMQMRYLIGKFTDTVSFYKAREIRNNRRYCIRRTRKLIEAQWL
ncbi:cytochrome c class I [Striga asiatica]|uniref:Cytochrome c class I n=1 Tax=Striga asiatica TaxID=4170 RepID=A0A5A7P122_STRAF|nr:cytochrome c class I [Striga asiatica]